MDGEKKDGDGEERGEGKGGLMDRQEQGKE